MQRQVLIDPSIEPLRERLRDPPGHRLLPGRVAHDALIARGSLGHQVTERTEWISEQPFPDRTGHRLECLPIATHGVLVGFPVQRQYLRDLFVGHGGGTALDRGRSCSITVLSKEGQYVN